MRILAVVVVTAACSAFVAALQDRPCELELQQAKRRLCVLQFHQDKDALALGECLSVV